MPTRAPQPDEDPNVKDEARIYDNLIEPFMYTVRQLPPAKRVKIIYWYISAVDEDNPVADKAEAGFELAAFSYEDAVEKLSFQSDRDVVAQAVKLVEQNSRG